MPDLFLTLLTATAGLLLGLSAIGCLACGAILDRESVRRAVLGAERRKSRL